MHNPSLKISTDFSASRFWLFSAGLFINLVSVLLKSKILKSLKFLLILLGDFDMINIIRVQIGYMIE